uniref:Regulating synaptic membrane exocytosis protein 2 n=1 Tax=Cacopsylla melanoneura TaxID=428564 RepID=A0A8D9DUH7_9HEMI
MCVTEGMVISMAQTNADLLPDLSHLTLEERQIIESVMMRQKQEEERELEIMRRKQDEVHLLEQSIRQRSEQQKKAGVELDATCHICLKTKFADGVGHMCNYCNIRCCARCGGKVTLRSNKVIWVCILCRKKQELLSKTGQWINKGMNSTPQGDAIMRKIEADMMFEDKRPKLERAHSASEKENQPMLTRTNSGLRRQYSQQETTPYRIPSSDSGVDMRHSTARSRDEELKYYRGELEGLMRQQYSNTSSSTSQYRNDSLSSEQSSSHLSHKKRDRRSGGSSGGVVKPGTMSQSQLIQQGSFSSSEDDIRSTSEGTTSCEEHDSEKGSTGNEGSGHSIGRKEKQAILDERIKKFLANPNDARRRSGLTAITIRTTSTTSPRPAKIPASTRLLPAKIRTLLSTRCHGNLARMGNI